MKRSAKSDAPRDPYTLAQLRDETLPVAPAFFEQSTVALARALLGCVLVHNDAAGMIVETEAYGGAEDRAAHSFHGKTQRTQVIFGPPGRAYVYFIYGMHECLNIVAEQEGTPGCVLLRALAPLAGLMPMRQRRAWAGPAPGLTNGPGKLTEALGITRALYGTSLLDGPLTVRGWRKPPVVPAGVTPRVGIRECTDWPVRFVWIGHPCLSRNVLPLSPVP